MDWVILTFEYAECFVLFVCFLQLERTVIRATFWENRVQLAVSSGFCGRYDLKDTRPVFFKQNVRDEEQRKLTGTRRG